MQITKTKNFSLKHTLECGQVFRWNSVKENDKQWYYGVVGNKVIKIRQEKNKLIHNTNKSFLTKYFRLDDNINEIYDNINKDKIINKAIQKYKGLHLIRQDPWECLISFLCSIQNNIPRIKTNIENICKKFGHKVKFEGKTFYAFPKSEQLTKATINDFVKCKIGFRSRFLKHIIEFTNSKKLNKLKHQTYKESKEELMQLLGVGPKVADCVLLYALDFLEAVPEDTWINRIAEQYYKEKKAGQFFRNYFGKYAGYAQQYLYLLEKNQEN